MAVKKNVAKVAKKKVAKKKAAPVAMPATPSTPFSF